MAKGVLIDLPASTRMKRIFDGAQRYAAADRSDPFTLQRCLAHIRTGLCHPTQGGEDGYYDAEETSEMRMLPDGSDYRATVYKNLKRL